jgi:hypothetical protein
MKMGLKFSAALTIWLLFAISCKKSDDNAVDCISEVSNTPVSMASTVNPSQLSIIDNLFRQNNSSTTGQQFFSIDSNRIALAGYPDSVNQIAILSYVWFNNLPVFFWNNNYIFYNGVLQDRSIIYAGQIPGPDTSFRQNLVSLRLIYLRYNPSCRDSCLTAQPGYIDPAYFGRIGLAVATLVKAWKITPVGSNNPMVMIEDDNGAAWPVSLNLP